MNKYIYIGDNKIAGPLKMDKPEQTDAGSRLLYAWNQHIASLPKIEVVKEPTHSWEINQVLEKDIDFVIAESYLKEGIIIEAIPLSKTNTDVKLNTQYSEQNYSKGEKDLLASNSANGIDCCDAPVSCTNTDDQKGKGRARSVSIPLISKLLKETPLDIRLRTTIIMADTSNWDNGDYLGDWELVQETVKRLCENVHEWIMDGMPPLLNNEPNAQASVATGDAILKNDDNKKLKSVKEGDELNPENYKEVIEYIYDFAWEFGRHYELGDLDKIKAAIDERFELPEIAIPKILTMGVKEGERLYSKEDMIRYAHWVLVKCNLVNIELPLEEAGTLLNEYLSSPEFKNNQK